MELDVPIITPPPNIDFTAKTGPQSLSLCSALSGCAKYDQHEVTGGAAGYVESPIFDLFLAIPTQGRFLSIRFLPLEDTPGIREVG